MLFRTSYSHDSRWSHSCFVLSAIAAASFAFSTRIINRRCCFSNGARALHRYMPIRRQFTYSVPGLRPLCLSQCIAPRGGDGVPRPASHSFTPFQSHTQPTSDGRGRGEIALARHTVRGLANTSGTQRRVICIRSQPSRPPSIAAAAAAAAVRRRLRLLVVYVLGLSADASSPAASCSLRTVRVHYATCHGCVDKSAPTEREPPHHRHH